MGLSLSKKKREDQVDGVKQVIKEMRENLTAPAPNGGGVALEYDPSKTPEENAVYKPQRKPINEKVHNIVKNKYPDGSVTMGSPDAPDALPNQVK